MKSQKGVNLVSLSVAVIVIIAIAGTVLYNVRTNLGIQKLKSMQADIENLRGKAENYYLQYGALPILKQQEIDDSILSDNVKNENIDTGNYYVIDLSAMENITLTYGEDYEKLKDETPENIQTLKAGTLTDVYIINAVSHNIFYVDGITYEGKKYYTQYQDEEKSKVGESNTKIDIRVEKRNNKVLLEIKKGEKAPENRNAIYKDEDEHTAIIPAGFTVSNEPDESSIEKGLVIRDKLGNEFVWIPVGISKTSNPNDKIILGRYSFDNLGNPGACSNEYVEENNTNTAQLNNDKNSLAKNINEFIEKTNNAGGFYIGRYEARREQETASENLEDIGLVERPEKYVSNNVTQSMAAELSQKMYQSDYFESDLINSYAWDTATLFLQEYDNRTNAVKENQYYNSKYSRQSILSSNLKQYGTNILEDQSKIDKICNVYDMADNCFEYTTETCVKKQSTPCTVRGCYYGNNSYYTSYRRGVDVTKKENYISFRPVLYIK